MPRRKGEGCKPLFNHTQTANDVEDSNFDMKTEVCGKQIDCLDKFENPATLRASSDDNSQYSPPRNKSDVWSRLGIRRDQLNSSGGVKKPSVFERLSWDH